MDYKTWTYDLKMYQANKESINEARSRLDLILYALTGVKGVDYTKTPSTFNPSLSEEKRLDLIDRYNAVEVEIERYEMAIRNVEIVKKRLPKNLWLMLNDKFVNDLTYKQVGEKYGFSDSGLWHYLKRETERFL